MGLTEIVHPRVALSIREEVRRYFAGRYGADLEALIFTGSMARDEGTATVTGDIVHVLGDAEFILIFGEAVHPVPGDAEVTRGCAEIEATLLQQGIRCAIGG